MGIHKKPHWTVHLEQNVLFAVWTLGNSVTIDCNVTRYSILQICFCSSLEVSFK